MSSDGWKEQMKLLKSGGGPAFPFQRTSLDGESQVSCSGMSLRDYFAAKAMHGLMASLKRDGIAYDPAVVSDESYKLADAMLRARER